MAIFHFFIKDNDWHLIYFSECDSDTSDNHWVEGNHIHLINHLWGSNIKEIWENFPKFSELNKAHNQKMYWMQRDEPVV